MKEIFSKIRYTPELQRLITKLAATEISGISEPCYFPPLKKSYNELLNVSGVSDSEIKNFIKRMLQGKISAEFKVMQPDAVLILLIMHLFIKNKNNVALSDTMVYYMVRQYSHVMSRQFPKYCKPEVFSYALSTLTKTHLFIREKTIANSIIYLSKELLLRYAKDISRWNVDELVKFVQASRHRISQSAKSFAETYYRADKEGYGLKTIVEPTEDQEEKGIFQKQFVERGKYVIEEVVKKLTIYRFVDRNALDYAMKFTGVKEEMAHSLLRELMSPKYSEELKMILTLYIKKMEDKSQLCGKNYIVFVRSLMTIKRTTDVIYFKKQILELLRTLLENTKNINKYKDLTNQNQFNLAAFLAIYLTSLFKNSICSTK
jgi:hypothetical protein